MIAFIDTKPTVAAHSDLFLVQFDSGGETVKLMLTRHALRYLEHQCRKADALATVAASGAEVIAFPKKRRRAK